MAKKKKPTRVIQMPQSTEAQVRSRARNLKLDKCYINSNWKEISEATILVTRKHKQGGTTFGIFLIDLAMKGLKDTFYNFNMTPVEYDDFAEDYLNGADHEEVDYNLVHNIIYGGIEYGEENDFSAHKDFSVSRYILEEDNEDIPLIEIVFGVDDEPAIFDDLSEYGEDFEEKIRDFEMNAAADHNREWDEYMDVVAGLPVVTEDDIVGGQTFGALENEALLDWSIKKWTGYFKQNPNNYGYYLLEFVTQMAWNNITGFLDMDHYDYMFGRQKDRKNAENKELSKMNREANQHLQAGEAHKIPGVYSEKCTLEDLFPKAKFIPVDDATEFCRIYCEYFITEGELDEAFSYSVIINILNPEEKSEIILRTQKRLLVQGIKRIKEIYIEHSKQDSGDNLVEEESPDLDLWREFYQLSDQIYALKPWKKLYEKEIFGIRMPETGKEYFVSVMGHVSKMYSISFYEGDRSIQEFWNLQQQILDQPPETILLINQLMLSWDKKEYLLPEQQEILDELKITSKRNKLCQNISQTIRGFVPCTPDNVAMRNVNILLTQSLDVLKREIKSGNVINKEERNRTQYMFRIPDNKDGILIWKDQREQIHEKEKGSISIEVGEEILHDFNSLPSKWNHLEINLNLLPIPIKEKKIRPFFPFALLMVDSNNGSVTAMAMLNPLPDYDTLIDSLPEEFMIKFIELGYRPKRVSVNSLQMLPTIQFLNEQTEVKAELAASLPAHKKALDELISSLQSKA